MSGENIVLLEKNQEERALDNQDKTVSPNFYEYFQLHHNFIDNLRKQASKIEQLLRVIDKLKEDLRVKQNQIQLMKRKQSQFNKSLISQQEQLRQQYLDKLKLVNEKLRLSEEENIQMRNTNEALKRENSRLERLNRIGSEIELKKGHSNNELSRLEQECSRVKKVLQNCKEENDILRIQLQDMTQWKNTLEKTVSKTGNKLQTLTQNYEHKLQLQQKDISIKNQQIQGLKLLAQQLEDRLKTMQGQTYHKLDAYDLQIKEMLRGVHEAQNKSEEWRKKYYEIVEWVLWIDRMKKEAKSAEMENFITKKVESIGQQLKGKQVGFDSLDKLNKSSSWVTTKKFPKLHTGII